MRILYTTPILEYPPAGGPQLRVANSIKALSGICELDIIHRIYGDEQSAKKTKAHFAPYSSEYHIASARNYKGSYPCIARWVDRILNRIINSDAEKFATYIINHADRRNIKIIWFGYGNISFSVIKKIKSKRPDFKVICDTDSVWSRFVMREIPYALGIRKLRIFYTGLNKRREEVISVRLCDVTTAVSDIDADYYRSLTDKHDKIHRFSNVIDLDQYKDRPRPPVNFKTPAMYLAGTFGHHNSPMDTAARWILEEVLPKVRSVLPNLHFYIVGRDSEVGFGNLSDANITVAGRVESVLPYLCNADVSIVPLKFESGTRFKILESGACGVPIVSTTLGAEGIPVIDGHHILLADTAEEFATAILRLLKDEGLRKKLTHNCRDLVSEQYGLDALATEGLAIIRYLQDSLQDIRLG
jgi:glycosyltransferase involved in cell wall biosynthesis